MVEISGLHIGVNQKAIVIDAGEAFLMWDYLVSRYDNIQLTQIFQNYAHDVDLKIILKTGLARLEKQVNQVENEMNKVQIPLPNRPPKTLNTEQGSEVWNDEFIFKIVITEMQSFLDQHIRTIRSMVTNDHLRKLYTKFLHDELNFFDDLCKYGKMKGWFSNPPLIKQ